MKYFFSLSIIFSAISSFAETKFSDFTGKYFFSHSTDPKAKEYSDKFSACTLVDKKAFKQLKGMSYCSKAEIGGFPGTIGDCSKKDGTKAYFYNTQKECESGRQDAVDGANS